MLRIGIIGTENSHAMAFAQYINLGKDKKTGAPLCPDARIVGVFGPDLEPSQKIMTDVGVDFIADKVEDFDGKVDAMMITSRRGSVHYEYAMPFIKKGIPVFVDKPITSDNEQTLKMIEEAKKHNTLITGGSGCKYAYDVITLKNSAEAMMNSGTLLSGAINFAISLDSIYDGIYFYASHLIEMTLTIFGYDMRSVIAKEKNGTITVIGRYDNFDITMHFTNNSSTSSCVLFGKSKNTYREIDISTIYAQEAEKFLNMIKTNTMPISHEELMKPVFVITAIADSIKTGNETPIQ